MAAIESAIGGKLKILSFILCLPLVVLTRLANRCVYGANGKSLGMDIALSIARWSTILPLSLKRGAVKALDANKTLNSPRFCQAKHELCQYIDRQDFGGYWVHRGSPDDTAISPSKCDLVLFWIHGGAYVLGEPLMSLPTILRMAEVLSSEGLSTATFSLKYGLAPEHVFPQPFDQGVAAYRYLLEELKVPAEKIVICGESAGGHLALVVLHELYKRKLPKPGYAILQYPWVDLTNSRDSVRRNRNNDMLVSADLDMAAQWAWNGRPGMFEEVLDFSAPRPANYWNSVLPRAWVGVGSHDLFVDAVSEFVEQAQSDGCSIKFEIFKHKPHGWPTMQDIWTRRSYLRLAPAANASSETPGATLLATALLDMVKLSS